MNDEHEFARELERLINRYSLEARSNTPDFILAEYVRGCLTAFNAATQSRDVWYGVDLKPGWRGAQPGGPEGS